VHRMADGKVVPGTKRERAGDIADGRYVAMAVKPSFAETERARQRHRPSRNGVARLAHGNRDVSRPGRAVCVF